MRLTIVNRYFWPETVLVNDISQCFAEAGHDVTVLTGQADYNPEAAHPKRPREEEYNGVTVRCIQPWSPSGRGLARNIASLLFVFLAFFRILFGPRTDVVWTTSIPPIVQPVLLRVATRIRGAKLIYFPQDIYPEIAEVSGLMKRGILSGLLRRLDGWVLRTADRVVTISGDMQAVLIERGARADSTSVIRSFSPYPEPTAPLVNPTDRPLKFLFAGNIGRFQNLDLIMEAFADLDPDMAELHFLGEGREKARLQGIVASRGIPNIHFLPGTTPEDAQQISRGFHAGIISLSPDVYKYAYPAKTYTYLAAGLPLFAVIETQSELTRVIEENEIGTPVDLTSSASQIAEAVRSFAKDQPKFAKAVLSRSDLHDANIARGRWTDLVDEMGGDGQRRPSLYRRFVKRPLEAIIVLLSAPAWLLVLWLIARKVRKEIGSPVLFTQDRPGLDGKPFKLVKFRTMSEDRGSDGALLPDDQRITPFGQRLRGTSLDELPELWNVLKGDMSLIGPRPLLMEYLPRYNAHQARRHDVRPGITGLAQVSGRNLMEWEDKFDTDVEYVDRCSFLLDAWILFRTFVVVLRKDGITEEGAVTMSPFLGSKEDEK